MNANTRREAFGSHQVSPEESERAQTNQRMLSCSRATHCGAQQIRSRFLSLSLSLAPDRLRAKRWLSTNATRLSHSIPSAWRRRTSYRVAIKEHAGAGLNLLIDSRSESSLVLLLTHTQLAPLRDLILDDPTDWTIIASSDG